MATPSFLPGETVSAAKLQALADDATYTPALTATTSDPTLGTGAFQNGVIHLNGEHVTAWITIRFGTGSAAGSGTYKIGLPSSYPIFTGSQDTPVGTARLIDDSGAEAVGIVFLDSANNELFIRTTDDGALVTNAAPWTWADLDYIQLHISYLTDFGA